MTQLFVVCLFAFGVTITSCGKNEGVGTQSCLDAAQEWSAALQNFTFDENSDLEAECERWKSAWSNFADKCNIEDYLTNQEYQDYLDSFNSLDCSDFN